MCFQHLSQAPDSKVFDSEDFSQTLLFGSFMRFLQMFLIPEDFSHYYTNPWGSQNT